MTIEEYIKSKERFTLMPFTTVYLTIMELINDGYIAPKLFELGGSFNVEKHKPKPKGEVCWGLYDQGDFVSNR